jgi:cytochrome c oxidase subunit 2
MAIQSTCPSRRHANPQLSGLLKGLVATVLSLATQLSFAAWDLNLQTPVTKTAQSAYDLHTGMLWLITIIFVGVFGVLGYSLYAHRLSKGHKPAQFHDNITVEVLWTVIPFIILGFVAVPATKSIVEMRNTTQSDMTVKATGHQWMWSYEYLTGDASTVKFTSVLSTPQAQIRGLEPKGENYLLEVDRPLVVPVNKKIRILTTSTDVIHAWSVPAFAVKTDAVPGFVRETWFRAEKEGTYRGQCSELCGKEHGYMPIVVEVVSDEKFAAWTAAQKASAAANASVKTADGAAPAQSGDKVQVVAASGKP